MKFEPMDILTVFIVIILVSCVAFPQIKLFLEVNDDSNVHVKYGMVESIQCSASGWGSSDVTVIVFYDGETIIFGEMIAINCHQSLRLEYLQVGDELASLIDLKYFNTTIYLEEEV